MRSFGQYVNGQYVQSGSFRRVQSPFHADSPVAQVAWIEASQPEHREIAEAALQGVSETFEQVQRGFFPLAERLAFLDRLRGKLNDNLDFLARLMTEEVGKPIRQARAEVQRGLSTLEWTSMEAPRFFAAEGLPTASRAPWRGLEGFTLREPRGPLLAITPFNFPVNLVLHKLAPALAAGCPVLLKPSPKAAACALAIADMCHAAELPAGMLSVLNCDDETTRRLAQDPRVAQISFTGSARVGWEIARGLTKPCFLEMGGNAPVFVDASADLDAAADKLIEGAFAYAGQVCISSQNVHAHAAVSEAFAVKLAERLARAKWGNPLREDTLAGPVIDEAAAARLLKAREEALRGGARLLAEASPAEGAGTGGTWVRPALFAQTPHEAALRREEIFGPYLNVDATPNFDAWLARVNQEPARFQCAVFTKDLGLTYRAAHELRFGAVLVNEPTSLRVEPMPFGGRGISGNSREGPRFALESFTEPKSVVIRVS